MITEQYSPLTKYQYKQLKRDESFKHGHLKLKEFLQIYQIENDRIIEMLDISPAYLSLVINGKKNISFKLARDFHELIFIVTGIPYTPEQIFLRDHDNINLLDRLNFLSTWNALSIYQQINIVYEINLLVRGI